MMRPSKPWSRPCSARSSIDDSSETLVARIEDSGREFDPTQFLLSFASGMHHERRDGRLRLALLFVELH